MWYFWPDLAFDLVKGLVAGAASLALQVVAPMTFRALKRFRARRFARKASQEEPGATRQRIMPWRWCRLERAKGEFRTANARHLRRSVGKEAAPAKSLALSLILARRMRASAAALVRGNWFSIPRTTASDGSTSLRVMLRKLSRAFCSPNVCGRVRQLALMRNGSEATASRATPAKIRSKRCLATFEKLRCVYKSYRRL